MPLYEGPSIDIEKYSCKFIDINGVVFVSPIDDILTLHKEVAQQEGIDDQVNELREMNPDHLDGGRLRVNNEQKTISVLETSTGYKIPISLEARRRTVEDIARLSPGYRVITPDLKSILNTIYTYRNE